MNAKNPLVAARQSMTGAQRVFALACEKSARILDARFSEAVGLAEASAAAVALLESDLELFDALEQERRAASTRREIAAAIKEHHATVDRVKVLQSLAWEDHLSAISAAATKMAAARVG